MFRRATLFFCVIFSLQLVAQDDRTVTEHQLTAESDYIRANQLKLLGKQEEALKLFEEIGRKDKRNHAAWYEAARIHEQLGQWENAEKAIRTAIRIEGGEPWYHIKYVDILEAQGKFADAAEVYRDLVPLRPDQQAFYDRWVYLLMRAQDWDGALRVLGQEASHFGESEEIGLQRAEILERSGDREAALAALNQLVARYPDNSGLLRWKAETLERFGMKDSLAEVYTQILKIDPGDAEARVRLAALTTEGSPSVTRLLALEQVISNPSVPAEEKVKALLPFLAEYSETEEQLLGDALTTNAEKLSAQHPGHAAVQALYADVLNFSGKLREASEAYERTLAIDDSNPLVWEQYLYALAETGQYIKLLDAADTALDLFPNKASHHLLYGAALMARGDWEEALDATDQALLMGSRDLYIKMTALLQKARCLHFLENIGRRNATVQMALDIDSKALPANILRYGYQCLEGSLDEGAIRDIEALKKNHPAAGTLNLFTIIGTGQANAEKLQAIQADSQIWNDGKALSWLGLWHLKNGREQEAVLTFQKACLLDDIYPETIFMKNITSKKG